MFLNRLEEVEKFAFLELVHYVGRCDHDFSNNEKEIIRNYCIEMQIDNIEFDISKFDLYDTVSKIKNSTSQKIVVLEIMALIYSDHFLHEEERKVIEVVIELFGLNYHIATVYGEWAKAISSLYIQGNSLIEI